MLRTSFRTLRAVTHFFAVIAIALFLGLGIAPESAAQSCKQTVVAQVVALDQPFMLNRLGSAMPQGMIFALKRDVVDLESGESCSTHACEAGHVTLRRDKRPRPLVLRVNQGQCLNIEFTNLLDAQPTNVLEPVTRAAGVHLTGLELLDINADATWAGTNKSSLASPGQQLNYHYFAKEEGTFLLYSAGGDWGGQLQSGLFGAVNVEPPHAEWYRSQVTHDDLMLSAYQAGDLAKRNEAPVPDMASGTLRRQFSAPGRQLTAEVEHQPHEVWKLTNVEPDRQTIHTTQVAIINNHLFALDGRPLIDYNAVYPQGHAHAGEPILRMYETRSDGSLELIYSDLTAIITGPNADRFPYSDVGPRFVANPALPDRRQPFREITVIYHETFAAVQAFSQFYDPGYAGAFGVVGSGAGADQFAINYGAAGITAEVLANRLGVGPMGNKDAVDLKFEEFFLSSWANGDPAMLVDVPANANNQQITDPAHNSQTTQQFKFDACSDSGDQQAFTQLNNGQIPSCLSDEFTKHNLTLSPTAQVSFVTQGAAGPGCGGYWVITDPNNSEPAGTNRKRYPIQQETSGSNCTLQAFEGFPVNPDMQSFNSLSGQRATKVFYPDDPSNVYHSYMRDHVKIRLLHGGGGITHVHHMHAHQWLHTPNSDNSAYLDSQMINPGSTYTLDMVYNGSGNRNQTVGDSIFHCHFYPHFAGGMWGLWRIHDVFEAGTELTKDGIPVAGWNRTLPDGEIDTGTPIPAVVPLPTLGMAPAPARTRLIDHGRRVEVEATIANGKKTYENPGYPFFVPGVSGHRAPHPPLDFAWEEERAGTPKLDAAGNRIYLDGGLPRHLILDGKTVREFHTRWDFTKDFVLYDKDGKPVSGGLLAFQLPEDGTEIEKAAMRAHSTRTHASLQPNGDPGNFTMNGLPATNGAPFANPSVDDDGNAQINTRRYQAAAIQVDAVFNKKGWHFPQERLLTLWGDVQPTVSGARALQPFFFRVNTGETIEFWHTNLVPDYYELDDFQVRTPTDIIGQHIHLVKFDVLASDGAANGFNYEDGTFSPDEVRKRIDAMNLTGGMHDFDPATQFIGTHQRILHAKDADPIFGNPPAGQNWKGAQTTIQRWDTDPLLNNQGVDRTMRTVFTHDHFGPSTHQQVGLYGGLLIEPEGSKWYDPITGGLLYNTAERADGGPTSWQANIVTPHVEESYREFALEFGDFQLAYNNQSPAADKKTGAPPTVPNAPLFNICTTLGVLPAPTAQLNCDTTQLNALVTSLNAGGIVSPLVRQAFARYGVTLAANATVQVQTKGSKWQIVNPLYTPVPGSNACSSRFAVCDTYPIALSSTANIGLQVSDPNMPAGWSDPQYAINAPADFYNSQNGGPAPTLISVVAPPGTYALNYRNEPLPLRLYNPTNNSTASGVQGDLSHVFRSIERADTQLNQQPQPLALIDPTQAGNPNAFKYPQNLVPTVNGEGQTCDPTNTAFNPAKAEPCDPYTPLLRAYAGDNVQIRTLVGSQHNPHYFDVQGIKWLFEPSDPNSGYRNSQPMGISEHFEMLFHLPPATTTSAVPFADYLYETNASTEGLTNGTWGLMRSYSHEVDQLKPLPNNPQAGAKTDNIAITPPPDAKVKSYHVVATTAAQALPGGTLVYNSRGQVISNSPLQFNQQLLIENPFAIIYVLADDLDSNGKWKDPSRRVEPLILRAATGEWLQITLTNAVDPTQTTFTQTSPAQAPFGEAPLPTINLQTSTSVGLQPQRVSFDVTQANGTNAGFNPVITTAPGSTSQPVYWYAGNISVKDGKIVTTPVELGGINLLPSDPMEQHPKGLVGALIVEPKDSTWKEDVNSRASATVTKGDSKFREFVVITEDDATVYSGTANGQPAPYTSFTLNYGAEAMPYRYPLALSPGGNFNSAGVDISEGTSDQLVQADPQTPLFVAGAGTPVRFHMLHPSGGPGNTDGNVYTISGHVWQEEPYTHGSREIGYNPLSQWLGTRGNHGARDHFEIVLDSAGGVNKVAGDYLYRSLLVALGGGDMQDGLWGIFRVSQPGKDALVITNAQPNGQQLTVNGTATVNPDTGTFAENVLLVSGTLNPTDHGCKGDALGFAPIQPSTGAWSFQGTVIGEMPHSICAQSVPYGGAYAWTLVQPLLRALPPTQPRKRAVPTIVHRLKETAQKEEPQDHDKDKEPKQ